MITDGDQSGTKDRILNAAERLFAEHGFEGTSLRAITSLAGVNLAAVNYHFQSKESLIHAVFSRRLGPINHKRIELLDAYVAEVASGPLSLERVIDIFIRPVLVLKRELPDRGNLFLRIMGRMLSEPGEFVKPILKEQFGVIIERFGPAFARALPGVPRSELAWRLNFTIGAMAHTMTGTGVLDMCAPGGYDPADVEGILRRLVSYAAAGMRGPVEPECRKKVKR